MKRLGWFSLFETIDYKYIDYYVEDRLQEFHGNCSELTDITNLNKMSKLFKITSKNF